MNDVIKLVVHLKQRKDVQSTVLSSYFTVIISDETYAKQLWSLGSAYITQRQIGNSDSLISSLGRV
jgi:hypothetical protein